MIRMGMKNGAYVALTLIGTCFSSINNIVFYTNRNAKTVIVRNIKLWLTCIK